ncbi:MAG: EF-P lysine aminoacylase EpmA [Bdellovibrionota bacterium]
MKEYRRSRAKVIETIRQYFGEQGFLETDTPSFVLSPGMEPHIRPIKIEGTKAFLPTSPEFAMKRILAQGYEKIFQVCKAYRHEPASATHNPEFTILEWYRAHVDYTAIMEDVEALFERIAQNLFGKAAFETETRGAQDLSRPWPRLTVEECFRRFAGLELRELLDVSAMAQACVAKGWAGREALLPSVLAQPGAWDDLFFRVMLNAVEPGLAKLGKPVIVYLYPESQAALANLETDSKGCRWAKRFEVYAGGLELGNAFDELVNPFEQRRRFEKDMELRKSLYGESFPISPIDEGFLESLGSMPKAGGIAMGVDRMVMYFTGAASIHEVLWLPSHWPETP